MADLHTNIECLKNACKNPRAQLDKYLAAGKKVIGCFEPYTPEELVHASGMIPMGLWGGHTELKLVKSYLPAFACPIMQANLEFGLNGTYKGISGVIIPAPLHDPELALRRSGYSDDPHRISAEPHLTGKHRLPDQRVRECSCHAGHHYWSDDDGKSTLQIH